MFWLFTYLKLFIIRKKFRPKEKQELWQKYHWLLCALIIHDFILNCYSQLWIKCLRCKNQAGGISASPGSFKLGSVSNILRAEDDIEVCLCNWRILFTVRVQSSFFGKVIVMYHRTTWLQLGCIQCKQFGKYKRQPPSLVK